MERPRFERGFSYRNAATMHIRSPCTAFGCLTDLGPGASVERDRKALAKPRNSGCDGTDTARCEYAPCLLFAESEHSMVASRMTTVRAKAEMTESGPDLSMGRNGTLTTYTSYETLSRQGQAKIVGGVERHRLGGQGIVGVIATTLGRDLARKPSRPELSSQKIVSQDQVRVRGNFCA